MFKRCRLLWWHLSRQHICPGDIGSYIQYLSFLLVQFWPNFLDPIFFGSWFLQTKMFLDKTSSDPHFFNAKFFFQTQKRDVMRNFWRDIIYEIGPWLAQSVRQNQHNNSSHASWFVWANQRLTSFIMSLQKFCFHPSLKK